MNTRRSWVVAGAALPALAWTGALRAQTTAQTSGPVLIGWLGTVSREADGNQMKAFHEGMAALGWKLGTHYVLESRHADARQERLPALAQELAAKKPAVIVTTLSGPAKAAATAAPATPIVTANGDPLAAGLVANLARPGGLITGVSNVAGDSSRKAIELLVESLPRLRRVGFLADASTAALADNVRNARSMAQRFRLEATIVEMAGPQDIDAAFARLAKAKAGAKVEALVLLPSAWFSSHLPALMEQALAQRLPVAGNSLMLARLGGLFTFGADPIALARRSAYYVDRILKGANPGELPIEQPTVFRLVLNLKTANALGITFPPSMLVRATEVIE